MPQLKTTKRPAGQSDAYLFVEDTGSGARFKAARASSLAADGSPAITVSLSPVDAQGKALLDAAGAPDVSTLTHTFTDEELRDPAFDAEARVSEMLAQLAADKQAVRSAREKVLALEGKWGSAAIDLSKRVPRAPGV